MRVPGPGKPGELAHAEAQGSGIDTASEPPRNRGVNLASQLSSLPLFHEFTASEMESLASLADRETVEPGTSIVKQDDPGDAMYLIVAGSARVTHREGDKQFEFATLQTGEFFGEFALVDDGPRSADVIAIDRCELVKISQGMLRALAGVYPGAAFKLLAAIGRAMVARARASNRKYLDTVLLCRQAEREA